MSVNLVAKEISQYPLPNFSTLVKQFIKENKVEVVWNKLIAETAQHYFSAYPHIGDASHYKAIGEKMYLAYPCIKMDAGCHAWSFFTKSLSQKVRHMRHNLKVKSQVPSTRRQESTGQTPSKKFRVMPETPNATYKTEEELQSHLLKLKEEWKKHKKNRDVGHIKMLLRETIHYRDEILRKNPQSLLKVVVAEFACFSDAIYILFDFSVRYGNDRLKETSDNLKKVVGACYLLEVKEPINVEGNDTMLNVVTYIENSTKFDRNGKGGDSHFKSIITVFDDLEDVQIKKKLETKEKVPPNLIVFRNHGINAAAYIVGDDTTIRCQGSSISAAMLELLAVYYIFDIDYPKCYAMLLGFLQIFVMNEPFVHETSKKFKFFTKKFRTVFDKLQLEHVEGEKDN